MAKQAGVGNAVYKVVEVIGTSTQSWEDAARNAVETAGRKLRDLRVAEVVKTDMTVKDGKVQATKTANGENPLVHGGKPILGIDVWEHSYYIDYRNRRPDYLKAFMEHLVNWEHVAEMYAAAVK